MLEKRGVNILHPTPKVEVKILHGPSLPVTPPTTTTTTTPHPPHPPTPPPPPPHPTPPTPHPPGLAPFQIQSILFS